MKKCLSAEIRKAFGNKYFAFAIAFSLIFVFMDMFEVGKFVIEVSHPPFGPGGYGGIGLFISWIMVAGYSLGGYLLLFTWPMIAAMPYGWSYFSERKSGYAQQLIARCGKRTYLTSKFIANFLAGGCALLIPVLFDLLAMAMICPTAMPLATDLFTSINIGCIFSELYYTHPWIHSFLWCGMAFLWGGTAATLCLAGSCIFKKSAFVTVFPFVLLLALSAIVNVIYGFVEINVELAPLMLFSADPDGLNPWYVIFPEIALFLFGSLTMYLCHEKTHEFI